MRRFVNFFIVLGATVVLTAAAFAQGPGGPGGPGRGGPGGPGGPGMRGGMMGRMAQMNQEILAKLGLSPVQKKAVKALDAKTLKAREALRSQFKPGERPGPEVMTKMRKIRDDYDLGLTKILTKPQYAKYVALRKAKMDEFRKQRGFGGPGGPGGFRGPGAGGPGGPRR